MRKLLCVTGAGFLALFLVSTLAGTAGAAVVDWSGTFTVTIGDFPRDAWVGNGAGVATVNGSAGGDHLNTLQLPGGGITVTGTVPQTDPENATLITLRLDPSQPLKLPKGTLAPISGGGPLTLNTLTGATLSPNNARFQQCILFPGCGSYLPVPVAFPTTGPPFTRGLGIGGTATVNTFSKGPGLKISLAFNPWTLGAVQMVDVSTTYVSVPSTFEPHNVTNATVTVQGFKHGPASNTSSTAANSGVIQWVSPSRVLTSVDPPSSKLAVYGVLKLHFVPEPGMLLLLASGVGGLVLLGRSRMRG